jgi:translation initiation factor IF-2
LASLPRGGVGVFTFLQREGDAVEEKIGVVTDYLDRMGVAVIHLTDGDLHVGDQVHIAARTTEFTQWVESLQIEHEAVAEAPRGSEVAMKMEAPVHRRDEVFSGLHWMTRTPPEPV